jgi:hypothetical protein
MSLAERGRRFIPNQAVILSQTFSPASITNSEHRVLAHTLNKEDLQKSVRFPDHTDSDTKEYIHRITRPARFNLAYTQPQVLFLWSIIQREGAHAGRDGQCPCSRGSTRRPIPGTRARRAGRRPRRCRRGAAAAGAPRRPTSPGTMRGEAGAAATPGKKKKNGRPRARRTRRARTSGSAGGPRPRTAAASAASPRSGGRARASRSGATARAREGARARRRATPTRSRRSSAQEDGRASARRTCCASMGEVPAHGGCVRGGRRWPRRDGGR